MVDLGSPPLNLTLHVTVYTQILQGTSNYGPATQLSQGSPSVFSQNNNSFTTQNPGTTSIFDDSYEPNQTFSSPGSLEITSDICITNNGMDQLDKTNAQVFRQLEEQLSLNDECFNEISTFYREHENPYELSAAFFGPDDHEQPYDGYNGKKGRQTCTDVN